MIARMYERIPTYLLGQVAYDALTFFQKQKGAAHVASSMV